MVSKRKKGCLEYDNNGVNNSNKLKGVRDLGHLEESEIHEIETDQEFFNVLADILDFEKQQHNQDAHFLKPKLLRHIVQLLDSYLSTTSGNSASQAATLSVPLRKSIQRVREHFHREKVQFTQASAKLDFSTRSGTSPIPFNMNASGSHHQFVPRKPPATHLKSTSAMHISDSAINSSRLPSKTFQKITVLDGDSMDETEQQRGTLHPHIDIRMAEKYEDSANKSREQFRPNSGSKRRPNSARIQQQKKTFNNIAISGASLNKK